MTFIEDEKKKLKNLLTRLALSPQFNPFKSGVQSGRGGRDKKDFTTVSEEFYSYEQTTIHILWRWKTFERGRCEHFDSGRICLNDDCF